MATATMKPKPTARARSAKSPGKAAWTSGQFVFKGNGDVLIDEMVSRTTMAKIWAKIFGQINNGDPGKYTITFETLERPADARTSNGATPARRKPTK
jgi:hypothetical protein